MMKTKASEDHWTLATSRKHTDAWGYLLFYLKIKGVLRANTTAHYSNIHSLVRLNLTIRQVIASTARKINHCLTYIRQMAMALKFYEINSSKRLCRHIAVEKEQPVQCYVFWTILDIYWIAKLYLRHLNWIWTCDDGALSTLATTPLTLGDQKIKNVVSKRW